MNVTEGVVLGLGLVGAAITASAASKMAERNGCGPTESMAAGLLGAGLSIAVLPAAVATGAVATCYEVAGGFPATKSFAQGAKATYHDLRSEIQDRWAKAQREKVALHSVA